MLFFTFTFTFKQWYICTKISYKLEKIFLIIGFVNNPPSQGLGGLDLLNSFYHSFCPITRHKEQKGDRFLLI